MSAPIVQVLFKGSILRSLSFEGEQLRIGRMRENEIVIDNLSVSRFHATLTKQNGRIVLEDCGSENGCLVNGVPVQRAEVEPGDEILIGKHQLVLRSPLEPGVRAAEVLAERVASGAWDGAKTYMMGPETRDGVLAAESEEPGPDEPFSELESEQEGSDSSEDPIVVSEEDPAELLREPEADFGPARESAAPAERGESSEPEPDPAAPRYAGFVMQTEGKLDRVLRWEKDRLVAGRSNECDIVLRHAEVSRQHALFVREADRYQVRDLNSINGTHVNGERVKRQDLEVGDVVRIEDFEFTFVLERQPIANEIKTDSLPPRASREPDYDVTILEERSPLASPTALSPLDAVTDPTPREVEVAVVKPAITPVVCEEAPAAPKPVPALAPPVQDFEAEEAPRSTTPVPPLALAATPAQAVEPERAAGPTLELSLRIEDLPEPLRELFAGSEEIRLPAEIRLIPGRRS